MSATVQMPPMSTGSALRPGTMIISQAAISPDFTRAARPIGTRSRSLRRGAAVLLVVAVASLAAATRSDAQDSAGTDGRPATTTTTTTGVAATVADRSFEARRAAPSRVELEQRAIEVERLITASDTPPALRARSRFEAETLRERLRDGDLRAGDRVVVRVTGNLTIGDTLSVRAGQMISLPTLPDISLHGVLRSELSDHLTREIGRYVRDPIVRADALVRVAVLGPVGRPGFYALPSDVLLSDVVMTAGGPQQTADLNKTVIKRAGLEVWASGDFQRALREGFTLDQIDLRSGDEIIVAERKQRNWMQYVFTTTALVSAAVTIFALLNR